MTIWDDRILEYIQEHESGSASELKDTDYFRVSRSQVSRRLRRLADHGMLRHLGNGVYIITEEGERYLRGDLDAETLESSEENGETAQS